MAKQSRIRKEINETAKAWHKAGVLTKEQRDKIVKPKKKGKGK